MSLSRDCRITYRALADQHGISANAIRKRVQSLEDCGVIKYYTVELSRAMVDADHVFVIIYTDKSVPEDTFAELVFEHPQVARVFYDSYGACLVHAEHSSAEQLMELSSFLRKLESFKAMEVHPLPLPKGKRKELTNTEFRVLAPLLDNPRMRYSEIAKRAGLSARRVRKTVQSLIESRAVNFTIGLSLPNADISYIVYRLEWDPKSISASEVVDLFDERFPNEFWFEMHSASEPVMWGSFLIEHTVRSQEIEREILRIPSIEHKNTIIVYPSEFERNLRYLALKRTVKEAGFL